MKTKGESLDLLELTRGEFIAKCRKARDRLWKKNKTPITVDDIRRICPVPEEIDGRVMGVIFRDWQSVGFVKSARKLCHNRPIQRFVPY